MPKKPVMKVSGRKIVATTVSQYEVSFSLRSISVAIAFAAASIASTKPIDLLADAVEVALVVRLEALDPLDLHGDPLEQAALGRRRGASVSTAAS